MLDDELLTVDAPGATTREREGDEPEWLCCAACARRVASAAAAMSFDGAHRHRFRNPHGFEFRIGLYADAPGCVCEAQSSEHFSWFPGYEWRIALCAGCRWHLGWAFACVGNPGAGEPGGFYALIVDRLQAERGSGARG